MPNISPLLQKGAILSLDPTTGIPLGTIMLQYNPDTLTRSLKPQTVGEEPDRTEILRLKGPPIETIKCEVEIDATDQLAVADPVDDEPRHPAAALGARTAGLSVQRRADRQRGAVAARHDRDPADGIGADRVRLEHEPRSRPVRITDLSRSPRRRSTRSSIRSAPRSRSACGCSTSTTSAS